MVFEDELRNGGRTQLWRSKLGGKFCYPVDLKIIIWERLQDIGNQSFDLLRRGLP